MVVKFLEQFLHDRRTRWRHRALRHGGRLLLRPARLTPPGERPRSGCRPSSGVDPAAAGRGPAGAEADARRPARQALRTGSRDDWAERPARILVGRVRDTGDTGDRAASPSSTPTSCAAHPGELCSTRTRSCHRTACARVSKRHQHPVRRSPGLPGRDDRLRTGRVDAPRCTAATRTGAVRSGCRSTTWSSGSCVRYDQFFGDEFTVEYPTGSGQQRTFGEIAAGPRRPARRRSGCPAPTAADPCTAASRRLQTDPAWKDNLLFFEYFHGDNGAGLGRHAPDRLDGAGRRSDPRPAHAAGTDRGRPTRRFILLG